MYEVLASLAGLGLTLFADEFGVMDAISLVLGVALLGALVWFLGFALLPSYRLISSLLLQGATFVILTTGSLVAWGVIEISIRVLRAQGSIGTAEAEAIGTVVIAVAGLIAGRFYKLPDKISASKASAWALRVRYGKAYEQRSTDPSSPESQRYAYDAIWVETFVTGDAPQVCKSDGKVSVDGYGVRALVKRMCLLMSAQQL